MQSGGTGLSLQGTKGWVGNKGWAQPLEASAPRLLEWTSGTRDIKLPTSPGWEHRDFLDAVKAPRDPYFPVEDGHRCATMCHIGNIAMRLGCKLQWDPARERFAGDAAADAVRAPWSL